MHTAIELVFSKDDATWGSEMPVDRRAFRDDLQRARGFLRARPVKRFFSLPVIRSGLVPECIEAQCVAKMYLKSIR